jgi:hypothetical protein
MALVAGVAPASAGAAWTAPQTLSATGQDADFAQVDIDAQGDAVFIWRRFDGTNQRIQARARSASGVLSPIQNLSAAGQNAFDPQLAVDTDGDAVFIWRRFDGTNQRIQARARSAAGTLGPVQNLSAAGQNAFNPQMAVDADGDAVFTWQRSEGAQWRIQARARSAAGTLSPIQNLTAAERGTQYPEVGVSPQGRAIFTWRQFVPIASYCCWRIEARARSAAGALGPVQTLSPPPGTDQNAYFPQVGVNAQGGAVFSWQLREPGEGPRGTGRLQARARSAAGVLSPVQFISTRAGDGGGAGGTLAVDPAGNAVFTWTFSYSYVDGAAGSAQVQVRARSASGTLSPIQDLTRRAGDLGGRNSQVGVDDAGDAVVTWDRYQNDELRSVGAQVRSAAGALGPLQTFSFAGQHYLGPRPQVAVNGSGDAVLTWEDSDATNSGVIQAAAGP